MYDNREVIMALKVYLTREEIPSGVKVIDNNDSYFNANTTLKNSDLEILKTVDEAVYISEMTFLGRTKEFGALYKYSLSTGTKTLLNILSHPNICFDVKECGDNALQFLRYYNEGLILWSFPFYNIQDINDSEECNIECRGKHFNNICEFMDFDWSEVD